MKAITKPLSRALRWLLAQLDEAEPIGQAPAAPLLAERGPGPSLPKLDEQLPLYLEITEHKQGIGARLYQDPEATHLPLPDPQLQATIRPIADEPQNLGEIVASLLVDQPQSLTAVDERFQFELGRFLYDQTLGSLHADAQRQLLQWHRLDLRVRTNSEWIARLPWNLLAHEGVFLCAAGWGVSLCNRAALEDVHLPPSPRILVIAPEPEGHPTGAAKHVEELELMLTDFDQRLSLGQHLRVVATWEATIRTLAAFQPELIYYYGHAAGDQRTTRLAFQNQEDGKLELKPVSDLAMLLRSMERPPRLAYLCCCRGDAGGFLGVGKQLAAFIPAVITTRYWVAASTAQAWSLDLMRGLLGYGHQPHEAVAALYAHIHEQNLTTADPRWATPVIHAHYRRWLAAVPQPPNRLTEDPHWHLRIDRINQYNAVMAQTRLMLREKKPKSLAFCWYGTRGQGLESFHKRLLVELRQDLGNTHVYQVRPAWPQHLENYHASFHHMLTNCFGVSDLAAVPGRIRAETAAARSRQVLVYVRHEPVEHHELINPESLKMYLSWWNSEFAPLLKENQFALLSTSFQVNNPPAFSRYMASEAIDELPLDHCVFWLLDELERVAKKDLQRFLQTHNIILPGERREKVLQRILEKTGGHYDQTVEALKNLRNEVWSTTHRIDDSPTVLKTFDY